MLEIQELVKVYPGDEHALRGVDLCVNKGEITAIIGPSGSGKSTLIRCINRLVEPTSGSIILDGKDITKLSTTSLRKMRRKIGMVFQEYALVERLTVMENVLSGRLGYTSFFNSLIRKFPQTTIDEAFRLLEKVGLSEHYDKRADALSGGQRQRVGIARALLQNPEILLVDEPTASLDPKTSRQIMRLITDLAEERNLTVLINIHDVNLATIFAKRIIGLRAGVVVFDGTPDELDSEVLTDIYGKEDYSQVTSEVLPIKKSDPELKLVQSEV